MRPSTRFVVPCLVFLLLPLGSGRAVAAEPVERGDAVARLAASVERLTVLLEQEVKARAGEREVQRMQLIVEVLGARYRGIEQAEADARRVQGEADEARESLARIRARLEQIEHDRIAQGTEPTKDEREQQAMAEANAKLLEERVKRLDERSQALQGEIVSARRRLSRLESILDGWLDRVER